MMTPDGPKVLEYNCRFGDPETQSVLPLVDGDLLGALAGAAAGDLSGVTPGRGGTGAAVTVVVTAADYPERGDTGTPIEGLDAAEASGALVFHAGTAVHDGRVVTNGGRILGVTGLGDDGRRLRGAPPTRPRLVSVRRHAPSHRHRSARIRSVIAVRDGVPAAAIDQQAVDGKRDTNATGEREREAAPRTAGR